MDAEIRQTQLRYKGYALTGKAWLFANTGRNKPALGYIKRALDLISDDSIALDTEGYIIFNNGKLSKNKECFKDAIEYFKRAQEEADTDQETLLPRYHMGISYIELNNYDLAGEPFQNHIVVLPFPHSRSDESLHLYNTKYSIIHLHNDKIFVKPFYNFVSSRTNILFIVIEVNMIT